MMIYRSLHLYCTVRSPTKRDCSRYTPR